MKWLRNSCLITVLYLGMFPIASASTTKHQDNLALFSFGVISDVQYADKDVHGKRHFRSSLQRLRAAVATLNSHALRFTVQLGDFIDDGADSLATVTPVFNGLRHDKYHVLGNHDFALPRPDVLQQLEMRDPFYSFAYHGWRFVVLDTVDESLNGGWPAGSAKHARAAALLAVMKAEAAPNGYDFNGGVGEAQAAWLRETLASACAAAERVVLFAHLPLVESASSPVHLLWNHEQVLELVEHHDCVMAYFNGHAHDGGYAQRNRVHHVSFKAMLESPEHNAFAIVHVYHNRLQIEGFGAQPSLELFLRD